MPNSAIIKNIWQMLVKICYCFKNGWQQQHEWVQTAAVWRGSCLQGCLRTASHQVLPALVSKLSNALQQHQEEFLAAVGQEYVTVSRIADSCSTNGSRQHQYDSCLQGCLTAALYQVPPALVSKLSNALQQHHEEFLAADFRGWRQVLQGNHPTDS